MASTSFYNNTSATVSSGGTDAPSSGTVENWTITSSSGFPTSLTSGASEFHIADVVATSEKILVTAISSGTWTVTRGAESTTPVAHAANFTIEQVVTAGDFSAVIGGGSSSGLNPSGDTTGVSDAAIISNAITALPSTGGTIVMNPGNWYLQPGALVIAMGATRPVQILGYGAFINAVSGGSGAVIRFYGTASSSAANRAAITGLIIDGTNASAGTYGIHTGDLTGLKMDVIIQNFSGSGSIGLFLDNTVSWTEESSIRAWLINCTSHAVIQASAGYNSFGYSDFDFTIFQNNPNANGVSILNGAAVYHSSLRIRGDFATSTSAVTAAVLYIGGVNSSGGPSNGDTSLLMGNRVEIQVECNGSGAYTPYTISMDNTHYAYAAANYGILDFLDNAGGVPFTTANITEGQFRGRFVLNGDAGLGISNSATGYGASQGVFEPVLYTAPATATPGQVLTQLADFAQFTLTANTTINLAPSSQSGVTLGQPQRVTVKIQQAASGGPYTVTWPKPGSPTTAAPAVYWPGGAAPTMSTGAGAIDVYDLETTDGIHWYGVAHQAMS